MCGIVGYIGKRDSVPVLISGLECLEYRGYDSAGISYLNGSQKILTVKEQGKLNRLKAKLKGKKFDSRIGIGHTRWATHGEPSRANAHPHSDAWGNISLIHNGIIENYAEIRNELKKQGVKFKSETDTEVAANLIGYNFRKYPLIEAFRKSIKRFHGFFAFVLMAKDNPDRLLVFRRSNPLCIGLGKDENFIASDVTPLLPYTNQVIYLEDDEYAIVERHKVEIYSLETGKQIKRKPTVIKWNIAQAQKGGYPHYMLKEMHEQPEVISEILKSRLNKGRVYFDSLNKKAEMRLKAIERIHFVSCGTAYHAGLIGNYMLGECVNLPVEGTVSSEFRYEDPVVNKKDLVILITQSGETADTLAALREAKAKGAFTLAIVNVVGSTIAREADAVIYTHAGPEIGVASTKAYTAQLMIIALFSIYMSRIHKMSRLKRSEEQQLIKQLHKLPKQLQTTLNNLGPVKKCSKKLYKKKNFLYLGRGYNFPNALEGALKLKEITYAHAHGYPAGEMKHGPIALIDSEQPVICLCPQSKTYDKMVSNIEEIRSRKGIIISIATEGDKVIPKLSTHTFIVPRTHEMFSSILTAIPLQYMAYQIAVLNGRDVDQPRNLAKSVTVE